MRRMLFFSRTRRTEKRVVRLARQKRWKEAHDLVKRHPDVFSDAREFMIGRIEMQAEFAGSATGKRLADRDFVAERIRPLLGEGEWHVERVTDIAGGIAGSRNFRIDLRDGASGTTLTLFEKTYITFYNKKVLKIRDLFRSVNADDIFSPKYYGLHREKDFNSLIFAHVDGKPVPRADAYRLDFVRALWKQAPAQALSKKYGGDFLVSMRRAMEGAPFAKISAASPLSGHAILDAEKMLGGILPAMLKRVPMCIMHGDLGPQNLMACKATGRVYLLDWDNWAIAPAGFGMNARARDFDRLLARIAAGPDDCARAAGFPAFRFMLSLGCFVHHLRHERHAEAAAWVPLVAREHDALG